MNLYCENEKRHVFVMAIFNSPLTFALTYIVGLSVSNGQIIIIGKHIISYYLPSGPCKRSGHVGPLTRRSMRIANMEPLRVQHARRVQACVDTYIYLEFFGETSLFSDGIGSIGNAASSFSRDTNGIFTRSLVTSS